jgi:hypothetical protein
MVLRGFINAQYRREDNYDQRIEKIRTRGSIDYNKDRKINSVRYFIDSQLCHAVKKWTILLRRKYNGSFRLA